MYRLWSETCRRQNGLEVEVKEMKLLNYFIDVTILGDNLNFLRKGKN